MLKKLSNLKKFIADIYAFQDKSLSLSRELEWANIYHDSIRDKKYLEDLSLNVGRWAANYSFFYILNRILSEYKPRSILEFGLGESTKFISTYLIHELKESKHVVIEHDQEWIEAFTHKFSISDRSSVIHCPLVETKIHGFSCYTYQDFDKKVTEDYEVYLIDGPFGSDRFSRFDIVSLVRNFEQEKEFILVIDDTNRLGELDTVNEICSVLTEKKINFFRGDYSGVKQNTVIASKKYKYAISF